MWKWPELLENNKEFWMGKHKGFHRALYRLVLDELKWLWLLAEFPGAHWRQFQAVVADFSDQNVPLMSSMHDIMFHNLAVMSSWLGKSGALQGNNWAIHTEALFFCFLLDRTYWRRFWRGWLVIKVILQFHTHSIISTWLTLCSAEPASCPGYVKFSLVSCRAPPYCDFMVSWSALAGCPRPWSGHKGSGTGPSAALALQASIQTHPLHSAVNITNSWWHAS